MHPGAQHGDAHGRKIGPPFAVVVEIAEADQGLEQSRAAGGRIAEAVQDLLQRQAAGAGDRNARGSRTLAGPT